MKKRIYAGMLVFAISLLSLCFTGCGEKKQTDESLVWNFEQNLLASDFTSSSRKKSLENTCIVTIRNNIENTVTTLIVTEKNKKSEYQTISIAPGSGFQIKVTRGLSYKIELIDSKNHHYSKVTQTSGDENEYFLFESDYVELEFKDRDFKPLSVKDNLLKFFGM